MTHFLWVEDFKASKTTREENIVSSTVSSIFGNILDHKELSNRLAEEDSYDAQDFLSEKGILLKLNLLEALEFIHNPEELSKVDFVVLDVDMPLSREGQNDTNGYLPELIKQYQSEANLSKIAGYQLYTELVIELGFPKSHILFCSNHASYFDQLKNKFASANIKPPLSSNPNKPFLTKDDTVDIKEWFAHAQQDYFVLRRGIIEGCQNAKKLSMDKLYFNNFSKQTDPVTSEDILNYLNILENFLPLREPLNKKDLYKLFIRTLSHEWEAANTIRLDKNKKDAVLAWVMRNTRHWITHNSALFNDLDEKLVAYLFIINIRVMFDSGDESIQNYEQILLNLFSKEAISEDEFKIKSNYKLIPISMAYLDLNNLVLDEKDNKVHINDAFYFNELANNIQLSESDLKDDKRLFTKILYQMFWLTTSNPYVDKGHKRNLLEIKFRHFNYMEKPYVKELARYIYHSSFPEA